MVSHRIATPPLSEQEESYLCLLTIQESMERLVKLVSSYIDLRIMLNHELPLELIEHALILNHKYQSLSINLERFFPDYMQEQKWHNQFQRHRQLPRLSTESQAALERMGQHEIQLLWLINHMTRQ